MFPGKSQAAERNSNPAYTSTPNRHSMKILSPRNIDLDVTSDYNSSGSSIDTSQGICEVNFSFCSP